MTQHANRRQFLGATLGAGVTLAGGRFVAAQATPAASPVASPVPGAAGHGPARLLAMLQGAPAHILSPMGAVWADLSSALRLAQLAPFTTTTPKPDRMHQRMLANLDLGPGLFDWALAPDFAPTFGFSPFQMEQALELGTPPDSLLTFVHGPWNAPALIRAWTASKYKEVKTAAGAVWSWADGPKLDLQDPVSRYGLGKMNNATILPDGTIVFGLTIDLVTLALRTAQGKEAALAGDERIAGLVRSAPAELVSALVLPGTSLRNTFDAAQAVAAQQNPVVAATEAARQQQTEQRAVGVMPRPSFGLVGITGGLADPHIAVRLAVKNRAEADRAAKIMAYRVEHARSTSRNKPFADLLRLVSAAGQASPPVANADFALRNISGSFWYDMIQARDLGLIGWE